MAHDVKIHNAHPPASIGLGKKSILVALFIWLFTHHWSHQVGAPPNPTINTNDNDAFTTVLDALQVRQSLNVITPPSYLDLVSSFAIGHPPFNNTWMSMKLEETLKTHHSFVKVRSNPWMAGRLGVKTCSVRSEIAHRRLGAKSFMNRLNESAGSEKWSDRFLLFYFSIICYAQYLRGSEHSPSLFSGVVRIRGLCWMPLLMNYVGVLMRFISTSHGIRYLE